MMKASKRVDGLPTIYVGWYLHGFTWAVQQNFKSILVDPDEKPEIHLDEEAARKAALPALRGMTREILTEKYGEELVMELAQEVLTSVS